MAMLMNLLLWNMEKKNGTTQAKIKEKRIYKSQNLTILKYAASTGGYLLIDIYI